MRAIKVLPATSRQTKYATAVYDVLCELKHATNLQISEAVRLTYPGLSATTIHRATARLKTRGLISCALKPTDGSERYDITPTPRLRTPSPYN
jgi:Fe2+ or Zn2+ uptake regulation protein